MKHYFFSAITGILVLSAGLVDAAPRGYAPTQRHYSGNGPSHHYGQGHDSRWNNRLEVRAQLKLRKLGYYRGPVDGHFGRSSRAALVRFQRHQGLRPTAALDRWTVRALRL